MWATNVQEAKIHGFRSPQCESCGLCDETADHVIQCTIDSREKCRKKLYTELQTFLDTPDTPERVKKCVLAGIRSWLNNTVPETFDQVEPNGTKLLQNAYEEQTILGWNQVSRGYLSVRWKYLIQIEQLARKDSRRRKGKCKYRSPDTWGTSLIQLLWSHVLIMWDNRNEHVHNLYVKTGSTRDHEHLVLVAEQETLNSEDLPYKDREWLDKTVEDFKKIPLARLQQWVKNIRGLKKYVRKCRRLEEAEA